MNAQGMTKEYLLGKQAFLLALLTTCRLNKAKGSEIGWAEIHDGSVGELITIIESLSTENEQLKAQLATAIVMDEIAEITPEQVVKFRQMFTTKAQND
jgi:uncharacterized small protein (DUF1192 family)